MTPLLLIALVAGVPAGLALLLRVNTVYLFVSIVVGDLLVQSVGDTAGLTIRSFITTSSAETMTKVGLLAIPILLTLLILRKTLPTRQFLLQVVPLAANGALILVLAIPLMTESIRQNITSVPIGRGVYQATDVIIAGTACLHLILMWQLGRPPKDGRKRKHKG